jgi:uncharacterized membrane protein
LRTASILQSLRRRFPGIAVVLCALVVTAIPAYARSWRIADYRDAITIGQNGEAVIVERIDLVFIGQFQGIHRTVPTEYPGRFSSSYKLFLKVTSVQDGEGHTLKYEKKNIRSRDGDALDLKIYIPGAVDTNRVVQITYSCSNAVRWFDDYDEFYWNITGNDWPVPIDHAEATVTFPQAIPGLRAQAFTGIYGSHDTDARAEIKGPTAFFETNNPLPMRGGITLDVYIPRDGLTRPSSFTFALWWLRSNAVVLMPLFALCVMFPLWWKKGRDPHAGLSVAPMYEPPPDLTPAEVGTLIDDSVDPRDITSTVIDLAVRGYLKIEEVNERQLLFKHKDYIFTLQKPGPWEGLHSHEKVLLNNMFGEGDTTRLSSLKNRFYTAIPKIKQDIKAILKGKGMYTVDPDAAAGLTVLGALVIVAPFIALHLLEVINILAAPAMLVAAVIVSVAIVFLFGRVMTAKSMDGVKTRVQILGFQEFMNRVDKDRLQRMPPDTFEKFLPFAMALGVEHHWAQAFEGLIQNPPSWYVGPSYPGYGWNPLLFSNSMSSMSTDMHQVFVSAPRSSSTGSGFSSGGGFSGGGFSGGGFGGGGGSAF